VEHTQPRVAPLRYYVLKQALQDGGLARAALAHNPEHFAGVHVERDVLAGDDRSIVLAETANGENRFLYHSTTSRPARIFSQKDVSLQV
jgi:hypothetical protein